MLRATPISPNLINPLHNLHTEFNEVAPTSPFIVILTTKESPPKVLEKLKQLKQLKSFSILLIGWGLLPFSLFLFTLNLLLFHFASLRRAEVLVLPEKLNFGGTVWVPNYTRHRYPGHHLVFLTFREEAHNPYMLHVWHDIGDVEFISLPRFILDFYFRGRRVIIPRRRKFDPLAREIVAFLSRWLGRSPVLLTYFKVYMDWDIPEVYRKDIEAMLARTPQDPWAERWQDYLRYFVYFHLRRELTLKRPGLPPQLCERVEQVLAQARGESGSVRLCGFYLKKNSDDGPNGEPHKFDGSSFGSYLPALRFLVERGYQVLLTGDRELPSSVAEEFDGMVVDGDMLEDGFGLDPGLYLAYAALCTDIFAGDAAGGTSFAGLIADRPMLGLNAFQFCSAYGNLWIYYKHAYDHDGNHLSFADMTGKYAFTGNVPEAFTIEVNTADEILEAVRCYVEEMENPGSSEIDVTLEDMWPSYSGFKVGNCHISPAYVRNYRRKIAANPGLRSLNKAS